MVAFTFERFIVVRYPLKRTNVCTVRRAKLIIFGLTAMAAVVQILAPFTTGIIEAKEGGNSTNSSTGDDSKESNVIPPVDTHQIVMRVLTMIETVFTLVIPPVLTVVMNGLIIHRLYQFKRSFQPRRSNSSRRQSSRLLIPNPQPETVQVYVLFIFVFIQF